MLKLVPVSLKEANTFVAEHHRHHKPVTGHKFSLGCTQEGQLVGVAIVGRPVSRYLDDGMTLEVNRLCSTGEKNVCSFLYGAAARAGKALGYQRIVTYTLDTEPGTSLRAAGWKCMGLAGGKRWTGTRRPAADLYPAQMKLRYEKQLLERQKDFDKKTEGGTQSG
nr:XF1762 family protein [uncultured Acetatifactor sp.]